MANDYPDEALAPFADDVLLENVKKVREAVIGHRIVAAGKDPDVTYSNGYYDERGGFVITLDDGTRVVLGDTSDCCAFTELESFLLNAANIDHAITGVGTTEGFTKWHIHADMRDVLTLDVAWGEGSGYYGYGFDIAVIHPNEEESNA